MSQSSSPIPHGGGEFCPALACSPLPMAMVQGARHLVRDANPAFCLLVKKSRDQLLGRPFAECGPAAAATRAMLERVSRTGKPESLAELQPAAPPLHIPLNWTYAMWALPSAKNQPAEVVMQVTETVRFDSQAVAMNEALMISAVRQHELAEVAEASNTQLQVEITRHIRTARDLQEARDALENHAAELEKAVHERTSQLRDSIVDLEAFSYSVAHDLRAPIRAIRGFTDLALEQCRRHGDPTVVLFLEKIISAATRMDNLIQDLLTLSALSREHLALSAVDLDGLVRVLIQERPELNSPAAEIEVTGQLLSVRGHEATLTQCLTNLLGNAVKFVAPGMVPRIRIWTEEFPAPFAAMPAGTQGLFAPAGKSVPLVRLWIEDHGIGIPAESLQRIFEIFQRLHRPEEYEGTGIGLAIVRKSIERMGGRVGVESELGQGSRFWLELPQA